MRVLAWTATLSALLLVATGTACFSPDERDGAVACGAGGICPPGFSCAGDGLCYAEPQPIDAPAGDAPPRDADPPIVDARPPSGDGPDALITECNDGIDNDCDGRVDFGSDPGCMSALDPSEHGTKECDDGIDNDGDEGIDFHQVPGCGPTDPQCNGPDDPME